MAQPARVLLVGRDDDENSLTHALRTCGWNCVEVAPDDQPPVELDRRTRPDVVILNLLSELGRRPPRDFVAYARALRSRPGGSRLPIMMVGERRPEHTAGALAAASNADVDDVVLRPVNGVQISSRLKALTRLSTMHDELVRRCETTNRYGIDAPEVIPQLPPVADADVLVVGAGRHHGVFESALAPVATLTGALTHDTGLEYLERRNFDLVIVDAGSEGSEAEDFCRKCRANSRLFNTPIVLVADPGTIPDTSAAFATGITDLLETPVQPEELRVRMLALVREVRFRDAMRAVYREFRHHATGDALTGLYTRGFALEHTACLMRSAEVRGAAFSISYVEIRNIREINKLYGYAVGDRIIRQVGDLIGMLMRGEDLSARYHGNSFISLMPDTSQGSANVALARVSGVVNHTDFTVPEVSSPISVICAAAAGEYMSGETPEDMIGRIIRSTTAQSD